MPPVPGHGQFLDQISVKTYVGTPSFYCEMCPRKILKLGHAQFQKRDYTPVFITLVLSTNIKGRYVYSFWDFFPGGTFIRG